MRTGICAQDKVPAGKAKIEVVPKLGEPLKIVMQVNGKEVHTITKVNSQEVDKVANIQGLDRAMFT